MSLGFEQPGFSIGELPANADYSSSTTYQFTGVNLIVATGAGLTGSAWSVPAAAGALTLGVLQNSPILGEPANVMIEGISKALAGGTIAVGAKLTTAVGGAFTTAATGNIIVGIALESAVSGQIFSMLLRPLGTA
jgi:hypothetical protein